MQMYNVKSIISLSF